MPQSQSLGRHEVVVERLRQQLATSLEAHEQRLSVRLTELLQPPSDAVTAADVAARSAHAAMAAARAAAAAAIVVTRHASSSGGCGGGKLRSSVPPKAARLPAQQQQQQSQQQVLLRAAMMDNAVLASECMHLQQRLAQERALGAAACKAVSLKLAAEVLMLRKQLQIQ